MCPALANWIPDCVGEEEGFGGGKNQRSAPFGQKSTGFSESSKQASLFLVSWSLASKLLPTHLLDLQKVQGETSWDDISRVLVL